MFKTIPRKHAVTYYQTLEEVSRLVRQEKLKRKKLKTAKNHDIKMLKTIPKPIEIMH